MLTVGQRLKLEREKRGISVKDLETTTSIRSLYLEAIERDDFAAIPGEVYLKGFIRNYAIAMALDPDEVLGQYRVQTGTPARVADSEPEAPAAPATERKRRLGESRPPIVAARRRINWRRVMVLGLVLLAFICGLAYWLLSSMQAAGKNAQAPAQLPAAAPAATQSAALNARKPQLIQLQLLATDNCWTEVTADGKPVYSGMLKVNQKVTWEAKEMLRIKIGNAGAVQANLNGRPLPALGKPGEVVERVFSLADA